MHPRLLACLFLTLAVGFSQTPAAAMSPPHMNLSLSQEHLTVCQLAAGAPIPAWAATAKGFLTVSRTKEELSIVCTEGLPPAGVKQETGWRLFKIEGPLDFGLTGILASVLDPLAKAGISIFSVSTYNTDYVLVKQDKVEAAVAALRNAGHSVRVD